GVPWSVVFHSGGWYWTAMVYSPGARPYTRYSPRSFVTAILVAFIGRFLGRQGMTWTLASLIGSPSSFTTRPVIAPVRTRVKGRRVLVMSSVIRSAFSPRFGRWRYPSRVIVTVYSPGGRWRVNWPASFVVVPVPPPVDGRRMTSALLTGAALLSTTTPRTAPRSSCACPVSVRVSRKNRPSRCTTTLIWCMTAIVLLLGMAQQLVGVP